MLSKKVLIKDQSLYQTPRTSYYNPPIRKNSDMTERTCFDLNQNKRTCSCNLYHTKENYNNKGLYNNTILTRDEPYNNYLSDFLQQ